MSWIVLFGMIFLILYGLILIGYFWILFDFVKFLIGIFDKYFLFNKGLVINFVK